MPNFRYKAIVPSGKTLVGEMEAPSEAKVVDRLQKLGYVPIEAFPVTEAGSRAARHAFSWNRSISARQFELLTRKLARLVKAGIRLERAFEILIQSAETPASRRFLTKMLDELRSGITLAKSLESAGPPVTRLHVSMIEAGESAGLLHFSLEHLSDFLAKSRALRRDLIAALSYPMLVLAVSLTAIALLLTMVVPEFATLFKGEDQIPPLTQAVIGASEWFRTSWDKLAIGTALAILALLIGIRSAPVRRFLDRQILGTVFIGTVLRKEQVARFCRLLATLLANGVKVTTALPIVASSLTNTEMAKSMTPVIESVRSGGGLANGLAKSSCFPVLAVQMVRVGEESAQLDGVLFELAGFYEEDVAQSIKNLLRVLEPALIAMLGATIGVIIIATYMGIMSVNDIVL